ncbi:MAG: thrombospondin type 3 repeat-containing protein [Candidatus Eisenbacteria bacterium]|nr:thrombospondin type 3 repeat-containing protein [Candidatus Eisenbacteria bacterium]
MGIAEAFVVLPGQGTAWNFKPLPDREESDENYGGLGDMRVGFKVKAPLESETFSFAAMAEVSLPSGKNTELVMPGASAGTRLFTTDEANVFGRVCATFDLSDVAALTPLRVHVNAGYWLNRDESIVRFPSYMFPIPGRLENKDVLLAGLGLEFPSSIVTLFTELYTEQFIDGADVATFKENPILITPGARMNLPFGIVATAAVDLRLSGNDADTEFDPDDELPEWAFTLGFDFLPAVYGGDVDADGLGDDSDLCPTEAEDLDGYEDTDGCPDPDNDSDGILDAADRCPNEAETVNGYEDADGCPEPDADKDGVTDSADRCPDGREDRDGYEDEDGCPDLDNDGDGVPDMSDGCPNEPETVNGYQDADGCPDETPRAEEVVDTDRDGIPDAKDKCPSLAEDADGYADADGCPDIDNDLDGIVDAEDKCPNDPEDSDGVMDDDGCPDR